MLKSVVFNVKGPEVQRICSAVIPGVVSVKLMDLIPLITVPFVVALPVLINVLLLL